VITLYRRWSFGWSNSWAGFKWVRTSGAEA